MTDIFENSGNLADDMAEYLQTFLDETEEQLDDLVETMLALERNSTNADDLNEAFRLIHSIKGSAGMMGFDNITVLTHHLENRFERFRSGLAQLDEPTMNLVLRCIDFLRQCNNRLRDGEQLGSSRELLDELKRLEEQADAAATDEQKATAQTDEVVTDAAEAIASESLEEQDVGEDLVRMVVRFQAGLQLADLKAQLIVARLSGLGEVKSTHPSLDQLSDAGQFEQFVVRIETQEGLDRLRDAADVDGVESIEFVGTPAESITHVKEEATAVEEVVIGQPAGEMYDGLPSPSIVEEPADLEVHRTESRTEHEVSSESDDSPALERISKQASGGRESHDSRDPEAYTSGSPVLRPPPVSEPSATEKTTVKVAETMRVDIDRLDSLMNLTGELVVNRARFVQISGQISPALRKASMLNRVREFSDSLRRTIESMEGNASGGGDWSTQIQQLRAGLELMDEQSEIWNNGRQCFSQISEAIDQLSRVSHSLQRGVLETRMVPVGPLFNRFKRVVRDLSMERGKKVDLQIRGEKTELDKRMIDELGDPLVHLVRNSIDHGLESPEVRISRGKPEVGTIFLEASHSGNNVYIHVRDDGGGINVEKVKAKLTENQVLSTSVVDELSDEQALDYIWHPGFSTAKEVTDVSGRGVGMDVVKTRINQLNGTIEIDSTPQQGTTFTLRLPLTLAIISSLLIRLRDVMFSMPIDDVREIVSVHERDVVTVHGKQTFDVRGEFVPLVSIDDIFQWHAIDYGYGRAEEIRQSDKVSSVFSSRTRQSLEKHGGEEDQSLATSATTPFETISGQADSGSETAKVVILHAGGKTMGLRVDELLGSQDIVIKSLSDNFINIRGLSGASILGDGSVSLMLDVATVIDLATKTSRTREAEEVTT